MGILRIKTLNFWYLKIILLIPILSVSCTSANIVGVESTSTASKQEDAGGAIKKKDKKQESSQDSTLNDGDTIVSESDADAIIAEAKEVIEACQGEENELLESNIFFAERVDCSFANAPTAPPVITPGNLPRVQGQLQARESQSQVVSLPDGAIICGMTITSRQDEIQYDDFLAIKLQNYLLMVSNDELLEFMPSTAGVYTWDFNAIKNKPYGFEGGRYCLQDSRCQFPGHDRAGEVAFAVGTNAVATMSAKIKGQSDLNFTVTATGDNDDEDCWHTDIDLDVAIEYVIK